MLSDAKILIVDDDEINVLFIRTALDGKYNLFDAKDGEEAIVKIPEILPDLILLDWNMPKVDGIGVLEYLKANPDFSKIQVIMMTLNTNLKDMLYAYEKGVNDFIKKPFEMLELHARVKSMVQLAFFYKNELAKKNNEMVSVTMKLAENNKMIQNVITQIESFIPKEYESKLFKLKANIDKQVSENTWKDFEAHFVGVHPDFTKNLIQEHSDLTPSELRMCSLLRLNLSSKEISSITFTTVESVKVARSRIRKKLNLQNEDGLVAYLTQF